jgi:TonB family protein
MNTIVNYIVESSLCLGVITLFYYGFLRRQNMPGFSRWYLLLSLVFAAVIPFLHFSINGNGNGSTDDILYIGFMLDMINVYGTVVTQHVVPAVQQHTGIGWFYVVGFILLVVRLLFALYKIGILHRRTKVMHLEGMRVVLTGNVFQPFSFMNTVFMPESFRESEGFRSILQHESVHVRQKHTFDLILLELLLPIQWFNPFAWMLRKAIRENHEFLADRAVLDAGQSVSEYQKMLLYQVMGTKFDLGTGFGYSLTKKRFKMMKTRVNKKSMLLSGLLTTLLFAGILFVAATELTTRDLVYPEPTGMNETEKLPATEPDDPQKEVFMVVEVMPQHPGGTKGLQKYLSENIKYPPEAQKKGIQGKVFVGFVIDENGNVTDAKVVRSVDPLIDAEALRVVNGMQKWTPGKQRGKAVKVAFTLPINFALNDKAEASDGARVNGGKMTISEREIKTEGTKTLVKARVVDDTNKPLSGASVIIDKTTNGTITDKDGFFKLTLDDPNQTINISYVGKKSISMKVMEDNDQNDVFQIVEKMPVFPGEEEALSKFLSENIKYPEQALKDTIQGRVFVNFIVEKDGSVSNAKIARGVTESLDNEALRVINMMPKWIPGMQRGKPVRVSFTLPINFVLN